MNANRQSALAAGALFIAATVSTVILAGILTRSVVGDPADLAKIAANDTQVFLGALLQLIGAAACAGIAIALYPVLRAHGSALALGSVVFRAVESVFYVVGIAGLVMLVTLGGEAAAAGPADAGLYDRLAALVVAGREWIGFVAAPTFFALGALMYYWIMFRATLVPRWLSGWGIAGAIGCLAAATLALLGIIEPVTPAHLALNFPIFVQEMVLAVWLIGRGFSPAVATEPESTSTAELSATALAGAGAR